MNIQDVMQGIHRQYGVSEMANYEIEKFVEGLIKKDRSEQLILHNVSNQRELLNSFMDYLQESENEGETIVDKQAFINGFLETI